jgi:hypothetical protein
MTSSPRWVITTRLFFLARKKKSGSSLIRSKVTVTVSISGSESFM